MKLDRTIVLSFAAIMISLASLAVTCINYSESARLDAVEEARYQRKHRP